MNEVINDLPEAIRQQAQKALAEIESAGSMILAIKSGAQAYGFVQGLVCAGGVTSEQGDMIAELFDKTTENRLKILTLGLP
ncbi:hypothetical protein SAMN04489798_2169 [Pseudomonas arsenicoxydans]|uniref:Uncharacterized protein n=1 Tax=Pseudomonas arsenicoxydans TaxID=702115 RepID=A0A1H0H7R0_9PSED|nr:hypothetical protein [Pseudomonas arsenicoxydans]SDO15199.1 hypothetical protein SAMN04489798_2169 [Pseudomonas arsenicoxydans]